MNLDAAELQRLVQTIRNAARALSLSLRNHAPPLGTSPYPPYAVPISPAVQFTSIATISGLARVHFEFTQKVAFQAVAYEISSADQYPERSVFEALRLYGIRFMRFMLSEIQEGRVKIPLKRFDQLTQDMFDCCEGDTVTTQEIDRVIAELEPRFDCSSAKEEMFRQESKLAKDYLLVELEHIKNELSNLPQLKHGRQQE